MSHRHEIRAQLRQCPSVLDGFPSIVQEKLLPTVATGWKLWIPAHAINFGFIPPSQRVLYVNVIAVSKQHQ